MSEKMLIFEKSQPGRRCTTFPASDEPNIPASLKRKSAPVLPEVSELELVRHYVSLSHLNFSIDTNFYPLGSCSMKYNPKVHEKAARVPEIAGMHPMEPQNQHTLRMIWEMEQTLKAVTGMDTFTFQPAAGAQGEFVGISLIAAHHRANGNEKKVVLVPDSAHGTNPATAAMCGYDVVELKSTEDGTVDVDDLKAKMNDEVAGLMLTNPNTFGVFENEILEISDIVHAGGGLLYYDGANMNAFLGQCQPGAMGFDVVHINLHKTFTTPHGGGGPGSGPVGVKDMLKPYLPTPLVVQEGESFCLDFDLPESIGKVSTFWGNFGMVVRAYVYSKMLGAEGMRQTSEMAVLNANYIVHKLEDAYDRPKKAQPMHEGVLSASRQKKESGVGALDIAKRLIDYGIHPPTIYFPLPKVCPEALLIEPTETESLEQLDTFIDTMRKIAKEAHANPDLLKEAPHDTPVRRLDEATAARKPVLRWTEPSSGSAVD
ncbi:MAG: glycine dehydrogenase (aminomethyl-transferring) [Gemmatimonadetes bacterium]|nr:glycine dehydrogenase (aminomethyl-transferring) [Gemmatimonadota bacterium]HCK08374.1 aminomethyl-transferring glycine dehydrogenase subunit GcvPB [Candidatus Latescibacterota bacterium]|tara:strand:- start:227 stop:1684 length:1458 start_codon:yes stop_codon:yes gene_type:complete